MDRDPTIPINLELRQGEQPIQGTFRLGEQTPQPFWGWLQLSSLLLDAAGGGPEPANQVEAGPDGPRQGKSGSRHACE